MSGIRVFWLTVLLGVTFAFYAMGTQPLDVKPAAAAAPERVASAVASGGSASAASATGAKSTQLRVEVYYEALCLDSVHFIRNQLKLAMIENGLLKHTELVFVPYGKVSTWVDPSTKNTTLYCQHGEKECELNAVHACLIEHNSIAQQMEMINCLMGWKSNADECGSLLNIDINAAKRCKDHRSTAEILKKYADMTNAIDISFVPTIIIDGMFNRTEQRSIRYNFMGVFCKKYKSKFNTVLENC